MPIRKGGLDLRRRFPILRTGYSKAEVTRQNLRARTSSHYVRLPFHAFHTKKTELDSRFQNHVPPLSYCSYSLPRKARIEFAKEKTLKQEGIVIIARSDINQSSKKKKKKTRFRRRDLRSQSSASRLGNVEREHRHSAVR